MAEEFGLRDANDIDKIIETLNQKYAGRPSYKPTITSRINRPTALKNAIVKRDGTICKICLKEGFVKKTGERYCELHHMIELNRQAPRTLQSWNVLVVCPTCHKQLHHGNVRTVFLNPGWQIRIDGIEYLIR